MASLQKKWKGLAFCLLLAVPSWFLGKMFPIIGGAVIAIIAGMVIAVFMKNKDGLEDGIKFTSKKSTSVGGHSSGIRDELKCGTGDGKAVSAHYCMHHHHLSGDCLCAP